MSFRLLICEMSKVYRSVSLKLLYRYVPNVRHIFLYIVIQNYGDTKYFSNCITHIFRLKLCSINKICVYTAFFSHQDPKTIDNVQ